MHAQQCDPKDRKGKMSPNPSNYSTVGSPALQKESYLVTCSYLAPELSMPSTETQSDKCGT